MTLAFQTQINEKPNYFIAKIWMGIPVFYKHHLYDAYWDHHVRLIGKPWDVPDDPIQAKIHTIREDTQNRWRPGMKIHFVINNKQSNRFQFAPVSVCLSVQEIEIKFIPVYIDGKRVSTKFDVIIDGRSLKYREIVDLAYNDGFNSIDDFLNYFKGGFKGKIIHWTDLKY